MGYGIETRIARRSFDHLSEREAREALALYAVCVDATLALVGQQAESLHGLDYEDLRVAGRLAILEALGTYSEAAKCKVKTWVSRVVGWRIREVIRLASNDAEHYVGDALSWIGNAEDADAQGDEFGELLENRSDAEWLRAELGRLPPRHEYIITQYLTGKTQNQIGAQLGISGARVRFVKAQALERLRRSYARLDK